MTAQEMLRKEAFAKAEAAINTAYKALLEAGLPVLAMKIGAVRGLLPKNQ